MKLCTDERLICWYDTNTVLRSITQTEGAKQCSNFSRGSSWQRGCPSAWELTRSSCLPLLLPQSIELPGTDSLTKIFFDSLFLNSFYVVNGIVFTTLLFFRIHNFKKPYNITSFNRKKALIEKEDTLKTWSSLPYCRK